MFTLYDYFDYAGLFHFTVQKQSTEALMSIIIMDDTPSGPTGKLACFTGLARKSES